jgi:hypothetical protein
MHTHLSNRDTYNLQQLHHNENNEGTKNESFMGHIAIGITPFYNS